MACNYENITLEIARQAVRAYNVGLYGRGVKNPDLDGRARALFSAGLASTPSGVLEQVHFIGVDYGGVAGFPSARVLAPDIARDIFSVRARYVSLAGEAPPVIKSSPSVAVVAELFAPFQKQFKGKSNWLVWAAKFWHFLNPDAFPVLDSRVDKFFRTGSRSHSATKYVFVADRFREFSIGHVAWLQALREADGGLSWSDTKLWDKVCYGVVEIEACKAS